MIEQRTQRIGEVIEASTRGFMAQCYCLYDAPQLGSLVRTAGDAPVYGVVYDVSTHSIDPGRRPIAMGEDEETEEGVYQSNPQLAQLLRTEVSVLAVGHDADGLTWPGLPPSPPRIHAFVYRCSNQEAVHFTSDLGFLPLLLDGGMPAADQVTATFLKTASQAHEDGQAFLLKAGRELASLLSGQMPRLNTILRRLAL